ncbi:Athe_2463 domain-containing protein [Pseudobacteroides cellulosolvens]|uniref:PKD domain containing protein n=1 Tax=Pseudobacteroides cellulosolvens ATCC 35603 = DSM 2933 TaxID=398512 RepID=A0A0L6JNZ3_9FIRM|nr:hypothetical protein [Pseudobacteroides cellulosolvens]KNY27498.1 hypothetical protein Bccel_2769 [Pseudobacteroides cellulosolvens ATCC 35603 = DSM 2933]
MKRIIAILLIFLITLGIYKIPYSYAEEINGKITVDNSLKLFNESMKLFYGMKNVDKNNPDTWYFVNNIVRNGNYYSINTDLIKNAVIDEEHYYNLFIVYGSQYSVADNNQIYFKGKLEPRYLGFNQEGDNFENPNHPFDSWGGWKITDKVFIKNPWDNTPLSIKYNFVRSRFSGSEINLSRPDGTTYKGNLEKNIQLGLDLVRGPQTGKDLLVNPGKYADTRLYDVGSKPIDPETGKPGQWCDFVQVIQPPTYYSWGHGWIFRDNGSGYNYMSVPIAPFKLLQDNISVQINTTPVFSVYEDTEVNISSLVTADTDEAVKTSAHWEGVDASGKSIFDSKDPEFTIENGKKQSNIKTPALKSGKYTFKFTVNNQANPSPVESVYVDNSVKVTINVIPRVTINGTVTLDYDVLSRDFHRPLNNGNNISAVLELGENTETTRYTWIPNTTNGALDVTRTDPQNIFSGFKVLNNPPEVSSNKTTVNKTPIATASIKRQSLGDNPGWLYARNLIDLISVPVINYSGSVTREFKKEVYGVVSYSESTDNTTNPATTIKTPNYGWIYDGGGEMEALFNPLGTEPITVIAHVFNGTASLPKEKKFRQEYSASESSDTKKKMYWVSQSFNLNVHRWMKHLSSNGSVKSLEARPGQFDRVFKGQEEAEITYKVETPISKYYEYDRKNARNQEPPGNKSYPRVPFASDEDYSSIPYPFKSGYYFNPAGKYSVTLKTVTYKNRQELTQNHKDLLESIQNSFQFSSNLIYEESKKKYNLNINRTSNLLTITRGQTQSHYELIPHSPNNNGYTHEMFKEILEGWSESETIGSFNNYMYREFISDSNAPVYKVTETTTLTFEVNKNNKKLYTDYDMPDGNNYWMRASFNDFTYKGMKIKGTGMFDNIGINVVDSAYNDLFNDEN